jgi:hypothetical protein
MKPIDPFAAILRKLLRKLLWNGHIPSSKVRGRNRERLKSLFASGILKEESKAGGRRIVIESAEHFRKFITGCYPSGLAPEHAALPPRASGVAAFRDSKRSGSRNCEPVLLRGFDGAVLILEENPLPVAELTSTFGMASFINDGNPGFQYSGTVATVENLEMFLHFEDIKPKEKLAVYTGGRSSRLLLEWLASSGMSNCRIVHYGDWDPVGLDEYLRIKDACPGRTNLFVPDNLEELFRRYSNSGLIEGNIAIHGRLRSSNDPSVKYVVSLIDRFNAGLEQEVLLLDQE